MGAQQKGVLIMALTTQVGLEFIARNKANRTMLAFGNSVRQIRYRLGGLLTSVLAVAGVGGFGYMIRQQMKAIDSIAKMSDELKLSTMAITGWEHAAKISGTSIEALHKGLEIFVRRMGEASYGVGEGVRGLEMLNLTAKEMISMGTEEAFLKIADRISQAGTAAEQAGIAYNFFGRQGTQLLNMFQQGRGGIEAMRKEAERLGLTFSRFDAGQVEAANDALTRARATMTGLFRQLTIELAPYIEILANRFTDFATAGEGVGTNVTNIFENMSIGAIRFGSTLQTLPAYWKGFEAAAHESLAVVYELADVATNLDVLFKKLGMSKWKYTYKELAQQQRQIAAGLLEAGGRQLAGTYGQENAVRRFYDNLRREATQRRAQLESGAVGVGLGIVDSKTEEKATMDIAAAQRAMFRDMKQMTMVNYQFRLETIKNLKQKYIDSGIARVQVEQWYLEQTKKLDIERLRSSSSLIAGFKAAGLQMQMEIKSWGDIGYEAAMTMQRGFGSAFADIAMRIETVNDALRSLFMSVARVAMSRLGENIYAGIFGGLFGGLFVGEGGGGIGTPPGGWAALRAKAGLQYGGEVLETGWAKVHKGETYSGVGGGSNMTIIVENKGQPMNVLNAEMRDAEDERIVHIMVDNALRGGPVRRMVQEIIANME